MFPLLGFNGTVVRREGDAIREDRRKEGRSGQVTVVTGENNPARTADSLVDLPSAAASSFAIESSVLLLTAVEISEGLDGGSAGGRCA